MVTEDDAVLFPRTAAAEIYYFNEWEEYPCGVVGYEDDLI